jgi:hypothetical protein
MKKNWIYILLIAAHCLTSTATQAQSTQKKVQELNGHIFNSLDDIQSPFMSTQFELNMGIANTSVFNGKSVAIGDTSLFNIRNELLYVGLSLNYSQKIKEWANFFVRLKYAARSGTGPESIVTQGISSIITRETGVKFRLSKGEKHQLAMYFSLNNTEANLVDLTGYVDDLLNGANDPSVTQKVPALISSGGLALAIAPHPWLGLQLDGKLGYGETLERGENKWQYFVSGSVDFYLHPLISLPVSVTIGGSSNTQINTFSLQGDITDTGYFKIAYSGSDSFLIGLSLYAGRTPIEKSDKHVGVQGANFSTVLYF